LVDATVYDIDLLLERGISGVPHQLRRRFVYGCRSDLEVKALFPSNWNSLSELTIVKEPWCNQPPFSAPTTSEA